MVPVGRGANVYVLLCVVCIDAMALVARQKMLRAAVEESLDVSAATAGARDGISGNSGCAG